jgi:thiopeptide-type bacteriocin biosynthesis protein
MSPDSMYRPADFGMLRSPVLAIQNSLPRLDKHTDDATEAELTSFLQASASHPVLREAIAVSTPSLDRFLDEVSRHSPVRKTQLRKAALSVARYVIRAGNRSTPFGVLAGASPLYFTSRTLVVPGTSHMKHVSADGDWLVKLVRALEIRHEILTELDLVVDYEVVRKGAAVHFYADRLHHHGANRSAPVRKVLRANVVVDHVLQMATHPVRCGVLLDRLQVELPDYSRHRLTQLLAQLVDSRMLLTSLRPPLDGQDPLEHVVSQLAAMREASTQALVDRLRELRFRMATYQMMEVGEGRQSLSDVQAAAEELVPCTPAVQVDLRLAEHVTLPRRVAEEAAAAVDALWRMSPRESAERTRLQSYCDRFLEEYGSDTLVPLIELLDTEKGIGHPDSWLSRSDGKGEPSRADDVETAGRQEQRRTEALAELAWPAGRYAPEIVLDSAAVEALSRSSSFGPLPTTEVIFDLVAGSTTDIDDGAYRLVLKGGSHRAGALFGRFGRLLPELDQPLRQVFVHGGDPGVIAAQLVPQISSGFGYLVANAPRWADRVVRVGNFCPFDEEDGRTGPQGRDRQADHDVRDILIGLHDDGSFRVVSASSGEELQPGQASVMETEKLATPPGRFLHEVSLSRRRPWQLWSWNEFSAAPRLPRIRLGNAILALERWRPSREMLLAGNDRHRWQRAFAAWRERYAIPDEVAIGTTDQRLVLDLRSPLHQQLLHQEIRKSPTARVEELSTRTASGAGWLQGRVTEVVVPLLASSLHARGRATSRHDATRRAADHSSASRTSAVSSPSRSTPAHVSSVTLPERRAYPVGSEWLYVKIYSSAHLHDEILAERVPELLKAVRCDVDRSFFLRYRDPAAHIRLRLHGAPNKLTRHVLLQLGTWAEQLRAVGLVRDWSLHRYVPEMARYGGAEVMAAAESVFHADSKLASAQLSRVRATGSGVNRDVALALNLVDITREMRPEDWASWLVTNVPRDVHREEFRARRRELRTLVGADRKTVAKFCGDDELVEVWHERAAALGEYRRKLTHRKREFVPPEDPSRVVGSLLHMHHNRVKGTDSESEAVAHAMARGFAELTINTSRFT